MLTPFFYAATGVVDGTNLSAGIGTPHPFEVVLSPWLDGARLARRLNAAGLPGVSFEPYAFVRNGVLLSGVRLALSDSLRFKPATTAVYVLAAIRHQHPRHFRFVPRGGRYLFDTVWGTDRIRKDIARGAPAAAIVARWEPDLRRFLVLRSSYLLYP
jgi:uncharacterized protein YbbC (DUF1343 family)